MNSEEILFEGDLQDALTPGVFVDSVETAKSLVEHFSNANFVKFAVHKNDKKVLHFVYNHALYRYVE